MADVALEPASRRSHAELAEIFNAGYEDYYTPFTVDEAAFRFMVSSWDVEVDSSRVALVDGEPAGIAQLAIRGDRGWIAGIGVAKPHRGRGIGQALMHGVLDEARSRGLREVWLEVLTQNEPAIRLYEKLGFEHERELEVWTLEPLLAQEQKARPAPLEQAHARIRRERTEREPWQREDETISKLEGLEALEGAGGAILFGRTAQRVSVLQGVAESPNAARELLGGLPAEATVVQWFNATSEHPLSAAIAGLGGMLAHRQHEMRLSL